MATGAVAAAFSGVVTDPIQRRIALHLRRILRLINVVERASSTRTTMRASSAAIITSRACSAAGVGCARQEMVRSGKLAFPSLIVQALPTAPVPPSGRGQAAYLRRSAVHFGSRGFTK
jgi:hypothetical protein